ncbi:MAG: hypothetical protein JO129_02705 [Candidatus Dependentiae bacterium]|nr:hypothetical protein [Candidatus Dependentiae bacterium]
MENKICQIPEAKLLQHLGNLRKMIVHNYELENLSEFVLHDLCSGPCFHVDKAAYFINNPDFKMLRGIAGYSKQEPHAQLHDTWNNQKQFITSMKDSAFNQKVRNNLHESFEKGKNSEKYMVQKLADQLEIENPAYHVWNLKHANHGLLIYDPLKHDIEHAQKHLFDSLYYLGFCPVY